ncbi:hypothetical protein LAM01_01030 [Amylolactobacillus amylophilus]|nr:hypothetical protein LAM01_01030 [Amylolactobacillus amylophilus]
MKKYLVKHRKSTVLNAVWLTFNMLLSTLTSVLFTFSTNVIFERNLNKFLLWTGVNVLTWAVSITSEYFQDIS